MISVYVYERSLVAFMLQNHRLKSITAEALINYIVHMVVDVIVAILQMRYEITRKRWNEATANKSDKAALTTITAYNSLLFSFFFKKIYYSLNWSSIAFSSAHLSRRAFNLVERDEFIKLFLIAFRNRHENSSEWRKTINWSKSKCLTLINEFIMSNLKTTGTCSIVAITHFIVKTITDRAVKMIQSTSWREYV